MSTQEQVLFDQVRAIRHACQGDEHSAYGTGAAEFVVWQDPCCPTSAPFGFACKGCLEQVMTTHATAVCPGCRTKYAPARKNIVKVEPIGGW